MIAFRDVGAPDPLPCRCGATPLMTCEDYPADGVGRREAWAAVHCPACGTDGPWRSWPYANGDDRAKAVAERLARGLARDAWRLAIASRRTL